MKKIIPLIIIQLIVLTSMLFALDGMPRILLSPLAGEYEDPQYNVIAGTVYDSMLLSLRLIGTYEVLELPDDVKSSPDSAAVEGFIAGQSIDNVVSGTMTVEDDGGISFSVSLYIPETGETQGGIESYAGGILDVFDASDDLIVSLLTRFHVTHVGFGSLHLANTGYTANYDVFLGDVFLGHNLEYSRQVLIGDYNLRVVQSRFGHNRTVFEQPVTIEERKDLEINFSLPDLLDEERFLLSERKNSLSETMADKSAGNLSGATISQTISQLQALEAAGGVAEQLGAFLKLQALWEMQEEWWAMEEAPLEFSPDGFVAAPEFYADTAAWRDEEVKEQSLMNARLYCHILSMQAALELYEGKRDAGMALYNVILETGALFDSQTSFGFQGEYDELMEVIDRDKNDRWKEKRIGQLVKTRYLLAVKFKGEKKHTRVMVFVDRDNTKGMVSSSGWLILPGIIKFPYLKEMYKDDSFVLLIKERRKEPENFSFPVAGVNTFFVVPDNDPEYLRTLDIGRGYQRFSYSGYIGGNNENGGIEGINMQYRFLGGRLGASFGLEIDFYNLGIEAEYGEASLGFGGVIVQGDYYFLMRRRVEMSAGAFLFGGDWIESNPEIDVDLPSDAGCAGLSWKIFWKTGIFAEPYIENRIIMGDGVYTDNQMAYNLLFGLRL